MREREAESWRTTTPKARQGAQRGKGHIATPLLYSLGEAGVKHRRRRAASPSINSMVAKFEVMSISLTRRCKSLFVNLSNLLRNSWTEPFRIGDDWTLQFLGY